MHLDISQLSIPPADVVPEPTMEDWQTFDEMDCSGVINRLVYGLARRCRELEAEVERSKRNDRTGYMCNGCKTSIMEKDDLFVDEIRPEPRYWHPLCKVAARCDELKAEVERLRSKPDDVLANWPGDCG